MTILNQNPPADSLIAHGDGLSFDLDTTSTPSTAQISIQGSATEVAWTLAGGIQSGYTGTVTVVGAVYTFTNLRRTAGWDASPFTVVAEWVDGGVPSTSSFSMELATEALFPTDMTPRNPITQGTLTVTEDDGERSETVGHIDFVGATVTDEGNGKVRVETGGSSGSATTGLGIWTLTTGTPGTTQVRFNTAVLASVTDISFHDEREGGVDVTPLITDVVKAGDWILVERATAPTANYAYYTVDSDATYNSPESQVSVTYVGGVGSVAVGNTLSFKHIRKPASTSLFKTLSWNFDSSNTTTPATGAFSFNNNAAPTILYIHDQNQSVDSLGTLALAFWGKHTLRIIDVTDSAIVGTFRVTADPTAAGSVYTMAGTGGSGTGSFVNGREYKFEIAGVDAGATSFTQEQQFGVGYWTVSATNGTDPTAAGEMSTNDPDPFSTTTIELFQAPEDSTTDISAMLGSLKSGAYVYFREAGDVDDGHLYTLNADATDSGSLVTLSVTHVDSGAGNSWSGTFGLEVVQAPGGAAALDDLSDVTAPSPTDGQVLAWNAGAAAWQPSTVPGAGSAQWVSAGCYSIEIENVPADVGVGQIYLNNTTFASITEIQIHEDQYIANFANSHRVDATTVLADLQVGDKIAVGMGTTDGALLTITAVNGLTADRYSFAVSVDSSSGTWTDNDAGAMQLFRPVRGSNGSRTISLTASINVDTSNWHGWQINNGWNIESWTQDSGANSGDPTVNRFATGIIIPHDGTVTDARMILTTNAINGSTMDLEWWKMPITDGDTADQTATLVASLDNVAINGTSNAANVKPFVLDNPALSAGDVLFFYYTGDTAGLARLTLSLTYTID